MQISELIEGLQAIREEQGEVGISLAIQWSMDQRYEVSGECDLGILVIEGHVTLWGRAPVPPRRLPPKEEQDDPLLRYVGEPYAVISRRVLEGLEAAASVIVDALPKLRQVSASLGRGLETLNKLEEEICQ